MWHVPLAGLGDPLDRRQEGDDLGVTEVHEGERPLPQGADRGGGVPGGHRPPVSAGGRRRGDAVRRDGAEDGQRRAHGQRRPRSPRRRRLRPVAGPPELLLEAAARAGEGSSGAPAPTDTGASADDHLVEQPCVGERSREFAAEVEPDVAARPRRRPSRRARGDGAAAELDPRPRERQADRAHPARDVVRPAATRDGSVPGTRGRGSTRGRRAHRDRTDVGDERAVAQRAVALAAVCNSESSSRSGRR